MDDQKHTSVIAFWVAIAVVFVVLCFSALMQSMRVESIQGGTSNRFAILESHLTTIQSEVDKINDDELIQLRSQVKRIESEEIAKLRDELDELKQIVQRDGT